MFVSISMEEMRRERAFAATDAPQSSTPSYERGLREDCTRIVEKFVKMGNPRAVSSPSQSRKVDVVDLYAWDMV